MPKQKIELSKRRDFGELISDTFVFVAQNFKPLFKAIFTFCGLLILASIALSTLQQIKVKDYQQAISENSFGAFDSFFDMLGVEYVLLLFAMLFSYALVTTLVLSFMALYKQKGNEAPTTTELWEYIKYYIVRVTVAAFLLSILLSFATVLCLAPGVYVYPIFGLVFPIMIMENTSFTYGFNQAFTLIKNNWWTTFGALFVIGIIIYIGYAILSVPAVLIGVINELTHGSKKTFTSVPGIIVMSILQNLGVFFYAINIVTLGLCYYNLTEIKEGTGLLDRINLFGSNIPEDNSPAEEY